MIPATPSLLVAGASVCVGLGGGATGRSPFEERLLTEVHGVYNTEAHHRWDAAFVHHVGYWSHFDPRDERSGWTVPFECDLNAIGHWGLKHGLLRESASPGDLFLLRSRTEERFVRVGVLAFVERCVEVRDDFWEYECVTIEGDSGVDLALGGGTVMRHKRRLSAAHGDAFLDWAALPVKP